MDYIRDCSGAVLAGGENTRMPVLKGFIRIKGKPIIEKNIMTLKRLFRENLIVTNQPRFYTHIESTILLGDIYDIRGPMTGIFTSLINASNRWVFVSACDMPFISAPLIRYMASKRGGHDAVVPRLKKSVEPLFSLYSKKLLARMEKALLKDKRGIQDFLKNKNVKYITIEEIERHDPGSRSFINLNTPEDLKAL